MLFTQLWTDNTSATKREMKAQFRKECPYVPDDFQCYPIKNSKGNTREGSIQQMALDLALTANESKWPHLNSHPLFPSLQELDWQPWVSLNIENGNPQIKPQVGVCPAVALGSDLITYVDNCGLKATQQCFHPNILSTQQVVGILRILLPAI